MVTRFWREGHYRSGADGRDHWVEGHYVQREDWVHSPPMSEERRSWLAGVNWSRAYLDEGLPNSRCPRCGQAVWFFRNSSGGCAYFDELGKPWPKHPCMDSRAVANRTAAWQAIVDYHEAYGISELDQAVETIRDAYLLWRSLATEYASQNWTWQVIEAQYEIEDAMDALTDLPARITSVGIGKRRERLHKARLRLEDVERAQHEAQEEVQAARDRYLRILDQDRSDRTI